MCPVPPCMRNDRAARRRAYHRGSRTAEGKRSSPARVELAPDGPFAYQSRWRSNLCPSALPY